MAAPSRMLPSQSELRRMFSYVPDTGAITWNLREPLSKTDRMFNTIFGGKPAGSLSSGRADGSNRYPVVGFSDPNYRKVAAHRIVWKMMTGEEPPEQIDHRDGDELNLRWGNLRAATNGQNIQNSKRRKDNKSGTKGVCWDAGHKKWAVHVSLDKKQWKIGRFDRLEDAVEAVVAARLRLHGEFARI